MNPPTLTLSGTTLTLPLPKYAGVPQRAETNRSEMVSSGGYLRVQMSWSRIVYPLSFAAAPIATWEALRAMQHAAVLAGVAPTFTWDATGPYSYTVAGVSVAIRSLGDATRPYLDKTLVDFDLELVETDPRTT